MANKTQKQKYHGWNMGGIDNHERKRMMDIPIFRSEPTGARAFWVPLRLVAGLFLGLAASVSSHCDGVDFPATPPAILAAVTGQGIYHTDLGGEEPRILADTDTLGGPDVLGLAGYAGRAIYAAEDSRGLLVSRDAGKSFTALGTPQGTQGAPWGKIQINRDGHVYVWNNSFLSVSTDEGETWQSKPIPGELYAVRGDTIVSAGGNRLYISRDGGEDYTTFNLYQSFSGSINDLAVTKNFVYLATDGGLFRTNHQGEQITSLYTNTGLSAVTIADDRVFIGADGEALVSDDGGKNYETLVKFETSGSVTTTVQQIVAHKKHIALATFDQFCSTSSGSYLQCQGMVPQGQSGRVSQIFMDVPDSKNF